MQKPQWCPVKFPLELPWLNPSLRLVWEKGWRLVVLIVWIGSFETLDNWYVWYVFICFLLLVSLSFANSYIFAPCFGKMLEGSSHCCCTEVWHFSRRWLPAVEKELMKTQQALHIRAHEVAWLQEMLPHASPFHTFQAMEKEIQDRCGLCMFVETM